MKKVLILLVVILAFGLTVHAMAVAPNAPLNLNVNGESTTNTIKLKWDKPAPNGGANVIVGYKIWRA